ncbi:MAG: bifunctional serine/threonine-protein kinase/formylglycine-generating enzyme family protein [Gemmataceae bacterium]|nr:bifunctional serine/threonine-protein kinase/formylglycine-generating enzyme family protein [Gemmataceae bacterium]MDW8267323.1 bifunctional serine/threonine-protein kinase/formylglycine-generating enzyme family protein [Gemmataceae bacterium]
MRPLTDLGSLSDAQWEQLQDCADRLEQAWQKADSRTSSVSLHPFLPKPGDPLRLVVLHELVKTDLEIRWRRGRPVSLEQYLDKYPELGRAADLPASLIFEEYRIRQLHGDRPPLEQYRERFPEQYAALVELAEAEPVPTERVLPTNVTPPGLVPRPSIFSSAGALGPLGGHANQLLPVGDGYRMIKRLGSGTFGEVWLGEAPGGIQVAIKIINRPIDQEEAQRELAALELTKQLRHPYLVQTQSYSTTQDRLIIVMELADGSLRDRLKECRAEGKPGIPLDELIRYFSEAAEAIDFLHTKHVHHRDIKPENILLVQKHAKVADFGLARTLQSQRNQATATSSGTPAYMAPEVWRGKVSKHSDQYSLAISYAELRLNRRVYAGTDMIAMMEGHLHQTPDLSPLGEAEQQVLLRALAKDPEQRFPSCKEFLQALKRAVAPELRETSPELFLADTDPNGLHTDKDLGTAGGGSARARGVASATEIAGPPRAAGWRLPPGRRRSPWLLAGALAAAVFAATVVGTRPWSPAPSPRPEPASTLLDTAPPDISWFSPEIEEIRGKRYYKQIEITKAGIPIRFCLIPQEFDGDPPTFYMMETKVWNELFAKFAQERPAEVRNHLWKRGGVRNEADIGIENGRLPVLRVSVEDAYRFARWLGGNLPTAQQWDKAAGCYEGKRGPFRGEAPWNPKADPPEVAIGRGAEGPLPVGTATRDISPFGCRDMAGNGTEWTRNTVEVNRFVPVTESGHRPDVYLRGRSYAYDGPATRLRFTTLWEYEREQASLPYDDADPFTGFRVVLEPGR